MERVVTVILLLVKEEAIKLGMSEINARPLGSDFSGFGSKVCSAVRSVWNLLSCVIAVTVFSIVLSLDLDPSNRKVLFSKMIQITLCTSVSLEYRFPRPQPWRCLWLCYGS